MPAMELPTQADPIEWHADWLEFQLLSAPAEFISWADHARSLKVGVSEPDQPDHPDAGDWLERTVDDVAAELADRARACGEAQSAYAFQVTAEGVGRRAPGDGNVYAFLLALSVLGKGAAGPDHHGERLFEDVCERALCGHTGSGIAQSYAFGFPRRRGAPGFPDAVDELCGFLREGRGQRNSPEVADQKDAHLDIVSWRPFADRRPGQLIFFGQCATGDDWFSKIHELNPRGWCKLWLAEQFLADPVATFFVPFRVGRERWRRASVYGGILFDRCRIASCLQELRDDLGRQIDEWTKRALSVAIQS